ncbi:MAG: ABC transporter ATP-binding protein/permease [Lachnospiraceae bacterium]|nr:ABC transporter ATP-binding protein/permease [Lachnospiraceae bacterium]
MLQIKGIKKEYKTGGRVSLALNDVSLALRDNEFVAILGPSGSGKTTLLNIIGGLDRYNSGDLIINGISTKKYSDRDWDSYRNHAVGFIFQSYNLIPHQNVLSNVELALTISGVSKKERRKRAEEALIKVGLKEHMHKLPSQMSGGQMQRVAIARALVNDPEILLADEPTGALDSETSVQIMELLKEVAKDRLVVMVTHNPELAEQYSNRIVRLKDGIITSDTNPVTDEELKDEGAVHKNMGKSSMSFITALALSFNNLRTKLARTILVAFAGSIGIIGIALILSLSNGVDVYIKTVEEETLKEYPLQITSQSFDLSVLAPEYADEDEDDKAKKKREETEVREFRMASRAFSTVTSNDLAALKKFIDSPESGMDEVTRAVEYSYGVAPLLYQTNGDSVRQVNPDKTFSALGFGNTGSMSSILSSVSSTNVFFEMPKDTGLYEGQYDVMAGRWPQNYNECIVVLTSGGALADVAVYAMGLRDASELDEIVESFMRGEKIETDTEEYSYKYTDLVGITFKLVIPGDLYAYDENFDIWTDKSGDDKYMKELLDSCEDVTVVGVVRPKEDAVTTMLQLGINYPYTLSEHVQKEAEKRKIVQAQLSDPDTDVFTGLKFGEDENRDELGVEDMFTIDEDKMQEAFKIDESALAFDYSGIDLDASDISIVVNPEDFSMDFPELSETEIADMISGVKFNMSEEAQREMFNQIIAGYLVYAANDPSTNYANMQSAIGDYLNTESARKVITDNVREIIETSGQQIISTEELASLGSSLLSGYSGWAVSNGYITPEDMQSHIGEYLATEEAQGIINQAENSMINNLMLISVSDEQINKLMTELYAGYITYAAQNNMPDPTKLLPSFSDYLSTPEASAIIMDGVSKSLDTSELENRMTQTMGNYSKEISEQLAKGMENMMQSAMEALGSRIKTGMENAMGNMGESLENAFSFDEKAFAEAITLNMSEQEMSELFTTLLSDEHSTYEGNLRKLSYINPENPNSITIYPIDFDSKEKIKEILDSYNERMKLEDEDKVIVYTDIVGTLMSSVTDITNAITYVLIAFVSISLVVSSIMIGVITYISVLERRKEIGILRAIGASKHNISQVFNAETFIIGLLAGIMGIVVTLILIVPINHIIASFTDQPIRAALPFFGGVSLVLLSVILTLIGGIIPSRKAAKSDPVAALRTE